MGEVVSGYRRSSSRFQCWSDGHVRILVLLQVRVRWETQERELKEQVSSVQEQARKQLQTVSEQLQGKSEQLLERERLAGETEQRLQAQVQLLTERLADSKAELDKTELKLKEVSTVKMCLCYSFRASFTRHKG